jgi:predicted DNA-binding transcriptional regulator YafY
MDPVLALAVLREAAAQRQSLWIGYVDSTGTSSRRLVDPVSVEAGRVVAFDQAARELRTFSIHRVTGVAPAPRDHANPG